MTQRFADPELYSAFMDVINETFTEFYDALDTNNKNDIHARRELKRGLNFLINDLNNGSSFTHGFFEDHPELKFTTSNKVNQIIDTQPSPEVDLHIRNAIKNIEDEFMKENVGEKLSVGKDQGETAKELEKLVNLSRIADEKIKKLEAYVDENCGKSEAMEIREEEKRMYEDILSAAFLGNNSMI